MIDIRGCDRPATSEDRRCRFERLYRSHHAAVFAYLRRRGAPDPDALAAGAFVTLWRRLDEVGAPELAWLYRTAGLVLANDRRSRRRNADLPMRLGQDPTTNTVAEDPAELLDAKLDPDLAAAFRSLSDADQEALRLSVWEELEGALGCSRPAARVRTLRARRRLAAAVSNPLALRVTHPVTELDGGIR